MTGREYKKLPLRRAMRDGRNVRGRLNRDIETRGGMRAVEGAIVIIYDRYAGDVWVQTDPCSHCGIAFGCRVSHADVNLLEHDE